MKIVVQKFGGTSVATKDSREHCYKHIQNGLKKGKKVVVVVSAMGRIGEPYATDTLIGLAPQLNEREKDLIMNTGELITACVFSGELNQKGISNCVLTGGQAGIITNAVHNAAGIIDLRPERILNELKTTDVLVIAGFQGMTKDKEITTLGRGGSDTSATALGASLNAEVVDIFTDVEGIMTADPRIVVDSQMLKKTTYTEVVNLAYMGAKVIHPRAVEIAMQYNIPIRVRSTFLESEGTLITNHSELDLHRQREKGQFLTGITQTEDISHFTVASDTYAARNDLFSRLELSNISIDLININQLTVGFTVKKEMENDAEKIINSLNLTYENRNDVVKISLVGASMTGVPGVVRRIVSTLHSQNIPILQTTDSHTTIWVLVPKSHSVIAIQSLHKAFGLHKQITR